MGTVVYTDGVCYGDNQASGFLVVQDGKRIFARLTGQHTTARNEEILRLQALHEARDYVLAEDLLPATLPLLARFTPEQLEGLGHPEIQYPYWRDLELSPSKLTPHKYGSYYALLGHAVFETAYDRPVPDILTAPVPPYLRRARDVSVGEWVATENKTGQVLGLTLHDPYLTLVLKSSRGERHTVRVNADYFVAIPHESERPTAPQ